MRKSNQFFCGQAEQPGTVIILSKHQATGYENWVTKTWGRLCQVVKASGHLRPGYQNF